MRTTTLLIRAIMPVFVLAGLLFIQQNAAFGQCQSYIKVDDNMINTNQLTANGLSLPFWLKEGQTLAADQMVNSVSAIEFTVTNPGNQLEFSQVLSVTTVQTVPTGKVWKVESILKEISSLTSNNGAIFSNRGTYSFTVPSCASYICIEVWGGGAGGVAQTSGGGGGGGGYGQQCFSATPSSTLTVIVGAGGLNGSSPSSGTGSSVTGPGVSISATGGNAGSGGTGGTGGTSTATITVDGGMGTNGQNLGNPYYGGAGGASGGSPVSPGGLGSSGSFYTSSTIFYASTQGGFPGGGGGGQATGGGISSKGADGKVIITW